MPQSKHKKLSKKVKSLKFDKTEPCSGMNRTQCNDPKQSLSFLENIQSLNKSVI